MKRTRKRNFYKLDARLATNSGFHGASVPIAPTTRGWLCGREYIPLAEIVDDLFAQVQIPAAG